MRWQPWEIDARVPLPRVAPAPECVVCERDITGDVVTLDGEVLCLTHGALSAVSVLDDALSGDEVAPRVIEDARAILGMLMARARAIS
jgi:hypothetical protein